MKLTLEHHLVVTRLLIPYRPGRASPCNWRPPLPAAPRVRPSAASPVGRGTSGLVVSKAARRVGPVAASAVEGATELAGWIARECGSGVVNFPVGVGRGSDNSLPCLVASRPVAKGETLLAIPEVAWVSTQTVSRSPLGPLVGDLESWVQLVLWLVWCSQADGVDSSARHPYADSLPPPGQHTDSPLFWNETESGELAGSSLQSATAAYRSFLEATFVELETGLFEPNRSVFPSPVFTLDAFLWAAGWLRARAHPPLDQGDAISLVPLADLVQHSSASTAAWEIRRAGGLGGLGGQRAVCLKADRAYAAGEAIAMAFSTDPLASQLALDHGVVDVDGSAAGFPLTLAIPEDDPFFDDKADIAELAGVGVTGSWTLRPNAPPASDLVAYLRLICCTGEDAFHLDAVFRDAAWAHFQEPISRSNEAAVCEFLVRGCGAALGGYETSIREDLAALANGAEMGERERMAVRVRVGEKQTLAGYLQNFERRLEGLGDLEYYEDARSRALGAKNIMGVVKERPAVWKSGSMDLSQ